MRDSQSSGVLRFTAQLEQITFVDSEIITLKPIESAKSKGSSKQDRGAQGTTEADSATGAASKSTLRSVGAFFGG